jgi:pimeloyl-ACP methyl ester carboxylesterase
LQLVFRDVDLRADLGAIRADTLIAHSRGDRIIPHACSEALARGIPAARLTSLESGNHLLLGDEPAWPGFAQELRAFLS